MVKFMQSIGDKMLELLEAEAKKRDVTIQKLVRAIIIPDWMRRHSKGRTLSHPFPLATSMAKPTRSSRPSTAREPGSVDELWT